MKDNRRLVDDIHVYLQESERTMLAEAIHDVLRQYDGHKLTQLHAELVRMDTEHVRTLPFTNVADALNRYDVSVSLVRGHPTITFRTIDSSHNIFE